MNYTNCELIKAYLQDWAKNDLNPAKDETSEILKAFINNYPICDIDAPPSYSNISELLEEYSWNDTRYLAARIEQIKDSFDHEKSLDYNLLVFQAEIRSVQSQYPDRFDFNDRAKFPLVSEVKINVVDNVDRYFSPFLSRQDELSNNFLIISFIIAIIGCLLGIFTLFLYYSVSRKVQNELEVYLTSGDNKKGWKIINTVVERRLESYLPKLEREGALVLKKIENRSNDNLDEWEKIFQEAYNGNTEKLRELISQIEHRKEEFDNCRFYMSKGFDSKSKRFTGSVRSPPEEFVLYQFELIRENDHLATVVPYEEMSFDYLEMHYDELKRLFQFENFQSEEINEYVVVKPVTAYYDSENWRLLVEEKGKLYCYNAKSPKPGRFSSKH